MNQRFNVVFRNVCAERLARLILAGQERPEKGFVDVAEPEVQIIGPIEALPDAQRAAVIEAYRSCANSMERLIKHGSTPDELLEWVKGWRMPEAK